MLSNTLRNRPVLSLRSGGPIATALDAVIDPNNLKIIGWWCASPQHPGDSVLLADDVREVMPKGLKAIETSSTETYVSGTMAIDAGNDEHIKMPFITSFLFTCIKGKTEPYQFIWSSSLN